MLYKISKKGVVNYFFGLIIFSIGILNLIWVHPVPGIFFLLASLVYFAPLNRVLLKKFNFTFPFLIKILFGLLLIWFTLGVSDLGDRIDDWLR